MSQQENGGSKTCPVPLTKDQESLLVHAPNYTVAPKHPQNKEYITAVEVYHRFEPRSGRNESSDKRSSQTSLHCQIQHKQGRNEVIE